MNTQRVPVLMYHRLGESHNDWEKKYCVSPERFREHMQLLAKQGYHAVGINDFMDWMKGQRVLPEGSFLLTFDDGFLGIHDHAAAVLEPLKWPATVFLVSGLTGLCDEWCRDHNPSGATYPLLDQGHIESLRQRGFSFHSHTRSHPDLTSLSAPHLADELSGSRDDLTELLGEPVDYLAYPYGRYNAEVVGAAESAGYTAAFSVQPGFNRPDTDRFRIRRIDVFGTDTAAMLGRKIRFGSNDGTWKMSVLYYAKRFFHLN